MTAAAALRNIQILEDEKLVENSASTGAYFLEQLKSLKDDHPLIGDVRGIGMMLAIELVSDRESKKGFPSEFRIGERLADKFSENGLILRPGGSVINLSPSLCATTSDIDEISGVLDRAIGEIETEFDQDKGA